MGHVIGRRGRETYPEPRRASNGSGVQSVAAGDGISVNNTDPEVPVVSNTGVLSVNESDGSVIVNNTDPQAPTVSLPTPNVVQGVDTVGGVGTTYEFAQSFTPASRGVLVLASVTFTTGTALDIVDVWLENDATPGVRLQGVTLHSAGASAQSVSIQAIDSPTPNTVTSYRIFAQNTAGHTITVPGSGATVIVSGF